MWAEVEVEVQEDKTLATPSDVAKRLGLVSRYGVKFILFLPFQKDLASYHTKCYFFNS